MKNKKYSVILGNLGNTCDRFLSSGYKDPLDKDVMIAQAASIEGVTGIELVGTWDIDESNVAEMKRKLADKSAMLVDHPRPVRVRNGARDHWPRPLPRFARTR